EWTFNNFKEACANDLSEEEVEELRKQVDIAKNSSLRPYEIAKYVRAFDDIMELRKGEKKMKIIQTIYTGFEWVSGEDDVDRRVEVVLYNEEGERLNSVSIGEGEPEDMRLFRDLSDAYTIYHLGRDTYEYGRKGIEIKFESKTEEY